MREKVEDRFARMNSREDALRAQGVCRIAGVDEAGRGPLAGDVFAAAVILDPDQPILGLNDSKKLSEKKREELFDIIKEKALAWCIATASVAEIDEFNILGAARLAMRRALEGLEPKPDHVLFDYIVMDYSDHPCEFIKKGDASSNSIAAASVLAKVARDRYMLELAKAYPVYGFEKHKGYGTKAHYEALDTHGPCPEHRHDFLRSWREKKSSGQAQG